MNDTSLARFLGGPPAAVLVRLILLSVLVGAVLMWLDIRPMEVFDALDRLVRRLGDLGFGAVRDIGVYLLTGAIIVLPLWLLGRLLNAGRHR